MPRHMTELSVFTKYRGRQNDGNYIYHMTRETRNTFHRERGTCWIAISAQLPSCPAIQQRPLCQTVVPKQLLFNLTMGGLTCFRASYARHGGGGSGDYPFSVPHIRRKDDPIDPSPVPGRRSASLLQHSYISKTQNSLDVTRSELHNSLSAR